MQALMKVQQAGTTSRPASGSAFLTGQLVTVTVPTLTIINNMLAIGSEWTELRLPKDADTWRQASTASDVWSEMRR